MLLLSNQVGVDVDFLSSENRVYVRVFIHSSIRIVCVNEAHVRSTQLKIFPQLVCDFYSNLMFGKSLVDEV